VNPTSRGAKLVLKAYADDGKPLGSPQSVSLDPGKQYQKEVGALFGLDPAQLVTGSLVVESDTSGIVGDVIFGDPTPMNLHRSALLLSDAPGKALVIPHLANSETIGTGIALSNSSSSAASVQVRVYAADGGSTGTVRVSIPANGRVSQALSQLVPAASGQTGGYITLDSDQPVTGVALIGPANGDTAAIAAQPYPGATAGSAPSPTLAVDTATLDFGSVAVGQSRPLSLTVRNTGTTDLQVTGISPASGAFPFTVSPTAFTAAAGGQQTVSVSFKPTSTGTVKATFSFTSNDPRGSSAVITLTGSAASSPAIAVTPARLDFGSVAASQSKTLTLSIANTGSGTLSVSSIAADNKLFTASASSASVAAGASYTLSVQFSPSSAGAQNGNLTLTSNDPAQTKLAIPLTGTGTAAPAGSDVVLKVDGGTFNTAIGFPKGADMVVFVNRLTPPSYPATIKDVQIYFGNRKDGLQTGAAITIVLATNPSGSAAFSAYGLRKRCNSPAGPHPSGKSREKMPGTGAKPALLMNAHGRVLGLVHRTVASHEADVLGILGRASYDVAILERRVRARAAQTVDGGAGELRHPAGFARAGPFVLPLPDFEGVRCAGQLPQAIVDVSDAIEMADTRAILAPNQRAVLPLPIGAPGREDLVKVGPRLRIRTERGEVILEVLIVGLARLPPGIMT
jgi:hypothetical protein